jgi:hypothetical protein
MLAKNSVSLSEFGQTAAVSLHKALNTRVKWIMRNRVVFDVEADPVDNSSIVLVRSGERRGLDLHGFIV